MQGLATAFEKMSDTERKAQIKKVCHGSYRAVSMYDERRTRAGADKGPVDKRYLSTECEER